LLGGGQEELGPHVMNVDWAEAYLRTKWHLDPPSRLATIYMGRKVGSAPFRDFDPSNRLATYTNVTDRHDRTDNGPIA